MMRRLAPLLLCGAAGALEAGAAGSLAGSLQRWYGPIGRGVPAESVTWHPPEGAGDGAYPLAATAAQVFPEVGSKSQATGALKRGELLLNGAPAEACRLLRAGDELTLAPRAMHVPRGPALDARVRFVGHLLEQGLRCVHEDEHVGVVFKPAGVHTKTNTRRGYGALEDALPAVLSPGAPAGADGAGGGEAPADALPLPLAMHRLDVRVSGLLLVAKTRRGALALSRQIEGRRVAKEYRALLVGELPRGLTAVTSDVGGAHARTEVRNLGCVAHEQWGAITEVSLTPLTGRTHQLRVHCAALGCAIVGDDLYWEAAAAAREGRFDGDIPPPRVERVAEGGDAAVADEGAHLARQADPLPPVRKGGGLYLQSVAVRCDGVDGTPIAAEVPPLPKFGQLLERARRAEEYRRRANPV